MIKSRLFVIGLSVFVVASFSCSTKKETISKSLQNTIKVSPKSIYYDELKDAPEWVKNTSSIPKLAAVGSAKIGKAGIQFARTEALAYARDELARTISLIVKNIIKNFAQTTGVGDEQTVDKVSVQASKQVAHVLLQGSKQKDMWISPSGELYVLVIVDEDIAKKLIKQSVETSFKNDKALWQQYQAKKAYEELENEIEKEIRKNNYN